MNVNKEYILMCEKAEEIQKKWQPQVGDWVLFNRLSLLKDEKRYFTGVVGINFQSHYTFAEGGRELDLNRSIWLPRQDQLQMLSGLSWQEFDKECLKYSMPTKEQAGLKVVLKLLDKTTQ